jgi:hypothetical protein
VQRRIHGDQRQADRQRREEEPEEAPLHETRVVTG